MEANARVVDHPTQALHGEKPLKLTLGAQKKTSVY